MGADCLEWSQQARHHPAVIAEGKGITPPKGVTVSAHYTGKLASNGDTFDSSVSRGTPFTFPVGGGRVIKVWSQAQPSSTSARGADPCVSLARPRGAIVPAPTPPPPPSPRAPTRVGILVLLP